MIILIFYNYNMIQVVSKNCVNEWCIFVIHFRTQILAELKYMFCEPEIWIQMTTIILKQFLLDLIINLQLTLINYYFIGINLFLKWSIYKSGLFFHATVTQNVFFGLDQIFCIIINVRVFRIIDINRCWHYFIKYQIVRTNEEIMLINVVVFSHLLVNVNLFK